MLGNTGMSGDLRYVRHMRTRAHRARINADAARASAERASDPQLKKHLLILAADYERIAQRAEQLAARTGKGFSRDAPDDS
jgi:hypothetical protein